ncbi:hypothetical protein N7478_009292 [Penicillium angulare]|uniref:uncharacterized protein n=1 Tax=Penicillium angulare TaxID=116970 RepID=UPI002540C89D|nr:uncharacterized protein N7478_009292 [Penicillium angulare]KAJ5266484.1 hypothetical protein N7478_009292 [Penicillium angulare]
MGETTWSDDYDKVKNHIIMRLSLQRRLIRGTPFAPVGTRTLEVSMQPRESLPHSSNARGQFVVKTFRLEEHRNNLKSLNVPIAEGKTLRDFVRPIQTKEMKPFAFRNKRHGLVGCRDFMSQLIQHLSQEEVVIFNGSNQRRSFMQNFLTRYGTDDMTWPINMEHGIFSDRREKM